MNDDIYSYPEIIEPHQGSMTIGDLHGNAVKFFYFLVRHQAVKVSKEDYQDFVDIYEQSGDILAIQIDGKRADLADVTDLLRVTVRNTANSATRLEEAQKAADLFPAPDSEAFKELSEVEQDESRKAYAILARRTQVWSNNDKERQKYFDALDQITTRAKEQFPELIQRFHNLLEKLELENKPEVIRLIGDELADRGNNDYFNLALMNYLKEKGIELRVNISNHSNEFLTDYEGMPTLGVRTNDRRSLINLKFLQDNGIVAKETTAQWVEQTYKHSLKVVDYQLTNDNPPKIRLFSHAPIRFDALAAVAQGLGVAYQDDTAQDLARTLDGINEAFAVCVREKRVHKLCADQSIMQQDDMSPEEIFRAPLVYLIWNRWHFLKDTAEARPAEKKGFFGVTRYLIDYFHGHDSYVSQYEHVHNLDNSLGKGTRAQELKTIKAAEEGVRKQPDNSQEAKDYQEAKNYLDSRKYSAFLASSSGLDAQAKPGLWDRVPPLKAIKLFFSDLAGAVGSVKDKFFSLFSLKKDEQNSSSEEYDSNLHASAHDEIHHPDATTSIPQEFSSPEFKKTGRKPHSGGAQLDHADGKVSKPMQFFTRKMPVAPQSEDDLDSSSEHGLK